MTRKHAVIDTWHYLDDFIVCGPPCSPSCRSDLRMLLDLCEYLGVPLTEKKVEGQSTCITVEIDTLAEEVLLPQAKLFQLQQRGKKKEGVQRRNCSQSKGNSNMLLE